MVAAGNAEVVPVELMRAGFVGDPVSLGVPEGAGFETGNLEPGARETLQENTPGGTDADDRKVDELIV
jgi:hypothetical protein